MNYNPKNQVKVDGKMNEIDAGKVANRLADAAFYASIVLSLSAFVMAVAKLIEALQ